MLLQSAIGNVQCIPVPAFFNIRKNTFLWVYIVAIFWWRSEYFPGDNFVITPGRYLSVLTGNQICFAMLWILMLSGSAMAKPVWFKYCNSLEWQIKPWTVLLSARQHCAVCPHYNSVFGVHDIELRYMRGVLYSNIWRCRHLMGANYQWACFITNATGVPLFKISKTHYYEAHYNDGRLHISKLNWWTLMCICAPSWSSW